MHGPLNSLVVVSVALALTGCVAEVTPPSARIVVPAPVVYVPPPPRPVVSVYVEPPISEPAPIAVGWAPPPLLVESPPPPPFDGAVWVGGYWVWQGDWVWAHGHWVGPPRPNYAWVHPYYENRDGVVLFITGHWSPPGVAFVPPPPGIHLTVEVAAAGVIAGPRPVGPPGCFVPAPPGSRPGIIIPAPVGTAPAVVTGAPPVVAVGMRITNNVNNTTIVHNNTVVNNTTNNVTNNITNVRNVTNITNVTIVAPPSATANGQAVNTSVPAQAHLAAAQPAVFKAQAPEPASTKPIPAFVHGKPPAELPPAQPVHAVSAGPMQANTRENEPHAGPNPQVKHTESPPQANSGPGPDANRHAEHTMAASDRPPNASSGGEPKANNPRPGNPPPPPPAAHAHDNPGHPPVAANNAKGQPPRDAHSNKPNDHKPSASEKSNAKANAKNDHSRKPGDKERSERERPAS